MAQDELAEFAPVIFVAERKKAFQDLTLEHGLVTALSTTSSKFMQKGRASLIMRVIKLDESAQTLWLETLEQSHEVPDNEILRFSFVLKSGQFLFEARLQRFKMGALYVSLSAISLLRLQRRANYRTTVSSTMKLVFAVHSVNDKPEAIEFAVLDISVGGFALWLKKTPSALKDTDQLKGVLLMPGREELELEGVVRYVKPHESGTGLKLGIALLNVNQTVERELLSIGLQIHRETIRR